MRKRNLILERVKKRETRMYLERTIDIIYSIVLFYRYYVYIDRWIGSIWGRDKEVNKLTNWFKERKLTQNGMSDCQVETESEKGIKILRKRQKERERDGEKEEREKKNRDRLKEKVSGR